ncbi:MAG TPA: isocitrate lyase/PEP mutase family protein [Steroidobacteraceae bacterium]|jgi:2-methylisocitrate lyase-like PEP mutase family enzyme|nr:isocitrate lyase/PEP mutase family protein [Steroidobacteraceae bacterium]
MTGAERLRAQLEGDRLIVAPGAHDCISGRLIAQAGFDALYMSGAGTAAMLGYPDYGLATMTEFADNAGRLVEATALPVIADADTGFGNELNAVRTVREYESRGVAGIQLEDQAFPKKCGHLDGKQLVDADDFLDKIRAAHAARRHPAFVIIARTDARSVLGVEAAVERANLALQAGADVAFVEAFHVFEGPAALVEVDAPDLQQRRPHLDIQRIGDGGLGERGADGLLTELEFEPLGAQQ